MAIPVREGRQAEGRDEGTPLNGGCERIRGFEAEIEDGLAVREATHKEQAHGHLLGVDGENAVMRIFMVYDVEGAIADSDDRCIVNDTRALDADKGTVVETAHTARLGRQWREAMRARDEQTRGTKVGYALKVDHATSQ